MQKTAEAHNSFIPQEENETKFPQIDCEPKTKEKYPLTDLREKASNRLFVIFLIGLGFWCIIVSIGAIIF